MNKFARLVGVSLVLVLAMSVGLGLASAQEDGEGGIVITSTFGSGPNNVSPVYCTGTDCQDDLVDNMFIDFVGVDPATATIAPNQTGALVRDWTVSDDNLVYTMNLRDDVFWSDGEQVNADDVLYHWDVLNAEEAAHPNAFLLDEIESVVKIDDFTVEFTMTSPACTALLNIGTAGEPLPSHIWGDIPMAELEASSETTAPSVTSGPFTFGEFRSGEAVTIIGNPNYVDGPTRAEGLIQTVVGDQTIQVEQLFEGEVSFLRSLAVDRQDEAEARSVEEGGNLQVYSYPGTSWDYLGMNIADPTNPQPAVDEDGNRIDQGHHPIFGDKMVRQALGHAIDVDAIIDGAVFGNGDRMTAHIVQASWAYNHDLAPRAYDPELALEMLAEAGWVPNDDGRLVCDGCLYAEEGAPFEFVLHTNTGNTRREAIGTVVQDQLDEIGITVDFQPIEFNTLIDIFLSQDYDAFILGWRAGYPDDPDNTQLFGAAADDPVAGGFNFTSFYNEEYFELEEQAKAVPGCDPEERSVLYARMQEIMQDEMPYIWLYSQNGMYVAGEELRNWSPFPNNYRYNVSEWFIQDS